MKRPEQQLQKSCVTWFKLQFPNALAFHPPNGRDAGSPHMGKLWKDLGVCSGIPDYMILDPPDPRFSFRGLAVEFKAGYGKSSPSQIEMQAKLRNIGWAVCECRTLEEFMDAVNRYMGK